MSDKPKQHAQRGIAEIDRDELTMRLLEIGCKIRRPVGSTGQQAMRSVRAMVRSGAVPAYIVEDFQAMADAAVKYLGECINDMKGVQ